MKPVQLRNKTLQTPIIQGGMGIGISRFNLAGAVAKEGALGVLSTAQIGYDDPEFKRHPEETNLRILPEQIKKAKELADGNGLIGVNIMSVTQLYEDYVKAVCEAGVDVIISGAGLPMSLPKYAKGYDVALAPIVSSAKSTNVILKVWDKKHNTTADFLVIEGPKAGGHLGFSQEELDTYTTESYDKEIKAILEAKAPYEEKYGHRIPVFVAGGIFTKEDTARILALGADGIQVASRFVVTEECDACYAYKQAYIDAREEDIVIIKSPVGMPGRALNNTFVQRMNAGGEKITYCFNCLKACNPKTAPYCITQALINATIGDLDNGLIFCGERVSELNKISSVSEVIRDLTV